MPKFLIRGLSHLTELCLGRGVGEDFGGNRHSSWGLPVTKYPQVQ